MIFALLLALCAACTVFHAPDWLTTAVYAALAVWALVDFIRSARTALRHHDHLIPNVPRAPRG